MFDEFSDYAASVGADITQMTPSQKQTLENAWRKTHYDNVIAKYAEANPYQVESITNEVDNAFAAGASPRQLELVGLRAARPGPGVTVIGGRMRDDNDGTVLEASLLNTLGASSAFVAKEYGQRAADAATSKQLRGLTLHGLVRAKLSQYGRNPGVGRLGLADIRDAFTPHAGPGGPSTYSLPNVLSNVANKLSMKAFDEAGTTWKVWCRTSSVNDFKARTGLRIIGTDLLANVPKGGEIKHGSLSEQTFTNTADTKGQLLGIDRRDLINDDLGVLQSVPTIMGRNAAITIEKAVYTTLIGNAGSFFASGNKNYSSGTPGSVLSDAGLVAAMQKFTEQTDPAGFPSHLTPSILLVPPALWAAARKLTVSNGVNTTTTANTPLPDANIWVDMFTLVTAPYLANSAGLSGVDTSWYLLVSPGDFSVVDVCFLQGKMTPTIESFDFDVNMLGLTTRAYHDFGVALMEPRGGVLSVGA